MISHKHKCIFIHIPKTGGASIERVIWPLDSDRTVENLWMGFIGPHPNERRVYCNKYQADGLQHLQASQIKTEVGEQQFNSYFKFSVVRNPWDKAVSQYLYIKNERIDLRKFIGMKRWTSFKRFLRLIGKIEHPHWIKQSDFLKDKEGHLMVDKIIKFENLQNEVQQVFHHLGIQNGRLPHINKTEKRRHYSSYYNKETIKMVENLYREDIESFSYTFEEYT